MAHGQFHKESISPRFYVPNIHKHTARWLQSAVVKPAKQEKQTKQKHGNTRGFFQFLHG